MDLENWLSFIYRVPEDKNIEPSFRLLRKDENIIVERVTFRSLYESPYEVNNFVYVDLFTPIKEEASVFLLFVHGLGLSRRKKRLYALLPERIARFGVASAFLSLPYHLERTPPGKTSSQWFSDFNDVETAAFYHQAVVDIIASVSALSRGRIPFIAGVSLGAMISVIALAVSERLKGGFLILGGGNYERIIWKSLTRFMVKETGCNRKICHRIYKRFPDYLEMVKKAGSWRKVLPPKICFLFEPLTFAPFAGKKEVVMINALFDMVIPRASAIELWNALGRPEIHWLPSTHGGAVFWGGKISRIILKKLKKADRFQTFD